MPRYSHSKLTTYQQCPQKYKFSYIERITVETEGIEGFMGSRVHEVLEKLYGDLKRGKTNTREDLLAHFEEIWNKEWHSHVTFANPVYTAEHFKEVGRRCITHYFNRYSPFTDGVTLGVEQRISFDLNPERDDTIEGVIDRLSRVEENTVEIHDYKTSQRLPTQEGINQDRQLALYQIGVQKTWPGVKEVRLIWHYLAFDQEMRSTRTPEDLETVKQWALGTISAIEKEREFPPRESPLCRWCEYQPICPLWRHLYTVESLPENEYLSEPGVRLVERLAELKAQEHATRKEIKKVEEALGEYAVRTGVEAIYSKTHKAAIYRGSRGGSSITTTVRLSPRQNRTS